MRAFLTPDFEVVGAVGDGSSLVEAAAQLRPDAIVLDVALPGPVSGTEAVRAIKKENPRTKIIYLTECSDVACAARAMAAGGSAYVLKTSPGTELAVAIQKR